MVRAMSPAIFEDISTRGITVPSDILAMAANCCRYITRLSSKVLNDSEESLTLAILTFFLINGARLRHDTLREVILRRNVVECIRTAKLDARPPVQAGEMIFIKSCRFPAVSMTDAGFVVRGVLSRLDKKIEVKISASDRDLYWKPNDATETKTLNEAEKRLHQVLAEHLSNIHHEGGKALRGILRQFWDSKQASGAAQHWSLQHIRVMMAKSVCRAIAELRLLWMARVHVPRRWTPWLGMFVPDNPDDSAAISFAFTSAETDHEYKDRGTKLAKKNGKVASLEVRFAPGTQQIMPKKWMNGLWFFKTAHQKKKKLVIPWPK